jgi:ribosome-associated protein
MPSGSRPAHRLERRSAVPATERSLDLAKTAATAADDKLATTIAGIDVSEQLALTDVFVIVSASTDRQVGAIVDEVEDQLRAKGAKPIRREGERDGRWVLLDFGDIVVHVQHDEEREFYELERLWKDCPEIDLGVPKRRDA